MYGIRWAHHIVGLASPTDNALAQLTRLNVENQDAFARAGGMAQLVALLTSNSLHVQTMAALALTEVPASSNQHCMYAQ